MSYVASSFEHEINNRRCCYFVANQILIDTIFNYNYLGIKRKKIGAEHFVQGELVDTDIFSNILK